MWLAGFGASGSRFRHWRWVCAVCGLGFFSIHGFRFSPLNVLKMTGSGKRFGLFCVSLCQCYPFQRHLALYAVLLMSSSWNSEPQIGFEGFSGLLLRNLGFRGLGV